MATAEQFDLVVQGGDSNRTGIVRDSAGRGYSMLLCQQPDLATPISSASTQLIHSGLRLAPVAVVARLQACLAAAALQRCPP